MSEEKIAEFNKAEGARPNPSSIMSAPREKKKFPVLLALIAGLTVSIVLNIIQLITFFSLNATTSQLRADINERESYISELKAKINSLEKR